MDGDGGASDETVAVRQPGGTNVCVIRGDGDLVNLNNSYGAISDATLKTDIVDSESQWADIASIRLRNFKPKASPSASQLGVVAQEVEEVSPGLISVDEAGLRSVKYSVLYLKAFGALQEAMHRIELLETRLEMLQGSK